MSLTLSPPFACLAAAGCLARAADPTHASNASTRLEAGVAVFENDHYRITAGDDNQVLIRNKATGETYRAWGDPHMEIDGRHAFDFWGTTTFALDDGTKVTIETTPWLGNPGMTVSSKVTITDGDYGVQITGVDTNTRGDLAIDEGRGWGRLVDRAVDDGNTLHENPLGRGFLGVDSQGRIRQVDQAFIHETDRLKGGALAETRREAFSLLSGLLAITFAGAFIGPLAAISVASSTRHDPHGRQPRSDDPLAPAGGTPSWRFDGAGPGLPAQRLLITLARLHD